LQGYLKWLLGQKMTTPCSRFKYTNYNLNLDFLHLKCLYFYFLYLCKLRFKITLQDRSHHRDSMLVYFKGGSIFVICVDKNGQTLTQMDAALVLNTGQWWDVTWLFSGGTYIFSKFFEMSQVQIYLYFNYPWFC
jgi:hypothetical protein